MLGASSQPYRRSVFSATDPGAMVAQLFFAIVDAFAQTVLVFTRRRFGERFFTPIRFAMSLGILWTLITLKSMSGWLLGLLPFLLPMMGMSPLWSLLAGPLLARPHGPPVHPLFDAANLLYWGFVIAGSGHLIAVFRRSWKIGDVEPVFSRSTGEPLLMLGGRVPYFVATIVLEPLAVIVLGELLHACDGTMPTAYFDMLAVFLNASALHQYRLYKDDLLDQQDAQLMAGFMTEQYKRVSAGEKPTSKLLGRFFRPLMLPRQPAMQVDVLRQWAKQHQEAAGLDTPGTVVPLRVVDGGKTKNGGGTPPNDEPPPPPPLRAA